VRINCCGLAVAEDGSLGMLGHLSALLRVDIIQAQQQVHQELAGEPLQAAAGESLNCICHLFIAQINGGL